MFQRMKITESPRWTNGNGSFAAAVVTEEPATFWRKLRVNEWTVSVSLFLFSLSMTLGKLYFNYRESLSWQIGDQLLANSGTFLDASNQYTGAAADVLVTFYERYWWLIKATLGGLAITSFTWFIIYMDSSVPGVNPPFPFSSSRQRVREGSTMHINYLVGALHGILFFIYMCF
ncbi:ADP-ribosylation factor-like protein 6-interacting protein 6 [Odontomachus brunneus]|uniref:ADP-ribosylation factor-like protein 6-interacting protein 6 n=1 Tax=Odontomachus brunneus TaxID=486640 RepID=UPI0013F19950|nr:ADP-ribosylation factor-like protein 6-interacting protein 6 [Odontomachus brunneus]